MADLNAQQVAALDERVKAHLATVIQQMNLRKWAMDAALAKDLTDPVPLAERIYGFVTRPALELFKPD